MNEHIAHTLLNEVLRLQEENKKLQESIKEIEARYDSKLTELSSKIAQQSEELEFEKNLLEWNRENVKSLLNITRPEKGEVAGLKYIKFDGVITNDATSPHPIEEFIRMSNVVDTYCKPSGGDSNDEETDCR